MKNDDDHMAITEFCRVARISRSTEKRLRRAGRSPDFARIPGGRGIRYSKRSVAAWLNRITVHTAMNRSEEA